MKDSKLHFYFLALAARGKGLSGSDRIFIELSKRWSKENPVEIFVWQEGFQMCHRQGLDKSRVKFNIVSLSSWEKHNFVINYVSLIIKGIWLAFKLDLKNDKFTIIYSASDFWMDCIPGWILKCRFPKINWIGSWYLTASNPRKGFIEDHTLIKNPQISPFLYWLSQKLAYNLVKRKSDFVFVTSEPDKLKFPNQLKDKRALAIKGGVDLEAINFWQKEFKGLPKIYDAVFQGRFHPQKGVVKLVDIWKIVVNKKHDAKLIMIGDGPLMQKVQNKISKLKLENNVTLVGYKYDGEKKYKIFHQTKIVVHPAIYDSGGMAAAEAMAWGLPGVSFNLEALKTYYPKGVLKASLGDEKEFAKLVIELLDNPKLYQKIATEAKDLILGNWDWNKRAREIVALIKNNL